MTGIRHPEITVQLTGEDDTRTSALLFCIRVLRLVPRAIVTAVSGMLPL
jgi:hypothetical protein